MFSSTVIPTIGRSTLARAVESVLSQDLPDADFEVIVVNDSGAPLPPADWQDSPRVQVIDTNRHERCVARNTGAAVATGDYLHFLDDDDWLLPGALQSLRRLSQENPDAIWLYGGSQLVDRQGEPLIQLHHQLPTDCFAQVMAGEWIPLQSSLIEADAFFAQAGFDYRIPGSEDIDLARRFAFLGSFAETTATIAAIGMGELESTTNWGVASEQTRGARERVLDKTGVFSQLRASASASRNHRSFWYGRIARIYMTSVLWNVRHRQPLSALSRALVSSGCLVLSGGHPLSREYWRGLLGKYDSFTFRRGFEEAGWSDRA